MIHGTARVYFLMVAGLAFVAVAALLARHVVRRGRVSLWLSFLFQCTVAVSIQVINDQTTGRFSSYGRAAGIHNAQRVVSWEMTHGLWVEPAWQRFFATTHHILFFTITWGPLSDRLTDFYVYCHLLAALFIAMWVWVYRRAWFPLVRNTYFITNAIACFLYVHFPVAPPRLTPGLTYDGHRYVFLDPLYGMINGASIPAQYRFNEFSAVPSVHVAWATIFALALIILSRRWWAALLGALYPCAVLLVIVVTGNHYIFDGLAGAAVALTAGLCALGLEWPRRQLVSWIRRWAPGPLFGARTGRSRRRPYPLGIPEVSG